MFVSLARQAVETYVRTGRIIRPDDFARQKPAGVFVSLHTKDGRLRGCIGSFLPVRENIGEEIIHNAIAAATADPRFPPVSLEELSQLTYSVDVLSQPKPVNHPQDPKKFGLIVSANDGRRGLLLPNIEGVETPEEQEKICRLKGYISPEEKVTYEIFTTKRYSEEEN